MQKKKSSKTVLWVALVAVLGIGGYFAVRAYQAPLAPAMDLPTPTSNVDTTVAPTTVAAPTTAPTTTPVVEKTCGQTGAMTILFVGSDSIGGVPPFGADSVRLIKVDFDAQKVAVVTFPRDLMVQTAALNNPSMAQQRLGLTFMYASQAAAGTPIEKNAAAAKVLAQVMLDDFAVRPDYYLTVQMNSLASMIDTIGGVELTIPAAITTDHHINFSAGKQTLSGALSTEYVRSLNPGGEAARTARQNEFIKALQTKVISASILPRVPTLLTQFKDAVVTDLSPEQLVNLACLTEKMPKDNITFGAIDAPGLVTNNIPNIDAVKSYLAQTLGN